MKDRLFIDNIEVDLPSGGSGIVLNTAVGKPADMSSVLSGYSYTIQLPRTAHNIQTFGFSTEVNVDTDYPHVEHSAMVVRDGVTLFDKGRAVVKSTSSTIEVLIYWGTNVRLETFSSSKMNEFPIDNVMRWDYTFKDSENEFLKWVPKLDGKRNQSPEHFRPAIKVSVLLDSILGPYVINSSYRSFIDKMWLMLPTTKGNKKVAENIAFRLSGQATSEVMDKRLWPDVLPQIDYGKINSYQKVYDLYYNLDPKIGPQFIRFPLGGRYRIKGTVIATNTLSGWTVGLYERPTDKIEEGFKPDYFQNITTSDVDIYVDIPAGDICIGAYSPLGTGKFDIDLTFSFSPETDKDYSETAFLMDYPIKENLPDITYIDFVKSIMGTMGLMIEPDAENGFNIFNVNDVIRNKENVVNIDEYLIDKKDNRLEYSTGLTKDNVLKYAEDDLVDKKFGSYRFSASTYEKNENIVFQSPYAATDKVIPLYTEEDKDGVSEFVLNKTTKCRLLLENGTILLGVYDKWITFDNPLVNFTSFTFEGLGYDSLVNKYWNGYIGVFANNPRISFRKVKLPSYIFSNISFINPMYAEGNYYMPISIKNYNEKGIAEIELALIDGVDISSDTLSNVLLEKYDSPIKFDIDKVALYARTGSEPDNGKMIRELDSVLDSEDLSNAYIPVDRGSGAAVKIPLNKIAGQSKPSSLWTPNKQSEYLHLNEDGTITILENSLTVKGNVLATGNVVAYSAGAYDITDSMKMVLDPLTLTVNEAGLITVIGGAGGGREYFAGNGMLLLNSNTFAAKFGVAAGTVMEGNDPRVVKLNSGSWWGQSMSDTGVVTGDVLLGGGNVISQIIGVTGGWERGFYWSPAGTTKGSGGLGMFGFDSNPSFIHLGFGEYNTYVSNMYINPSGQVAIGSGSFEGKLSVVQSVSSNTILTLKNSADQKYFRIFTTNTAGWIQFGKYDNSASSLSISGINAANLNELLLSAKEIIPNGIVRPNLTSRYDLGDVTHFWRDLYLSRNAVVEGSISNNDYLYSNLASRRASGNSIGTVKITCPFGFENNMNIYEIDIYEYVYGMGASKIIIGAYNYQDGIWYNTTYSITGSYNKGVRLCKDADGKVCILLGYTNTAWSYEKVYLRTLLKGGSTNVADIKTGYSISLITDETGLTNIAAPVLSNGQFSNVTAKNRICVSGYNSTPDTVNYGAVVATQQSGTNQYCHYALVRSGVSTMGLGLNATNDLIFGIPTSDSLITLANTKVTFTRAGDGLFKGNVVAYSAGAYDITDSMKMVLDPATLAVNEAGLITVIGGTSGGGKEYFPGAGLLLQGGNTFLAAFGISPGTVTEGGTTVLKSGDKMTGVLNIDHSLNPYVRFSVKGVNMGEVGSLAAAGIYLFNFARQKSLIYDNLGVLSFEGVPVFHQNNFSSISSRYTNSINGETVVDLSALDINTYYPVLMYALVHSMMQTFGVHVNLNTNKPSWATHASGFTCNCEIMARGSGYGTNGANMILTEYDSRFWSGYRPIGSIFQFTNSSNVAFYLRGGGIYKVYNNNGAAPQIITSSTTILGQVVEPRSCSSTEGSTAISSVLEDTYVAYNLSSFGASRIYGERIETANLEVITLNATDINYTGRIKQNAFGYTSYIGSTNAGFFHFQTTAPFFYFDQPLQISGSIYPYNNGDYSLGSDTNRWGALYTKDWVRSYGNVGWYSQTHGGGVYMRDANYVRVYGSKRFAVESTDSDSINTAGGILTQINNNGTSWDNWQYAQKALAVRETTVNVGSYLAILGWTTIISAGYRQYASIGSLRDGTNFGSVAITAGSHDSNATSAKYLFRYDGLLIVPILTANRIYTGYDSNANNAVSCSGWFRSNNSSGWMNDTHVGGIYMNEADWVKIYAKPLYIDSVKTYGIGGHNVGLKLYNANHVGINFANSAYTWGMYSNVDGNFYIGRRTGNVNNTSGNYVAKFQELGFESMGYINAYNYIRALTRAYISGDGLAPDTTNYGAISATQPNGSGWCHYALIKRGIATAGIGMDGSNNLIFGTHTATNGTMTTWATITRNGDGLFKGNVVAYSAGVHDIADDIKLLLDNNTIVVDPVTGLIKTSLSSANFVTLAGEQTIPGNKIFTGYYTRLPGHYYHNMYDGGTDVYVHYYDQSNRVTVSAANLRVSKPGGGILTWRFSGNGTANWEGTFTYQSDERIKNITGKHLDVLSNIDGINAYYYTFKEDILNTKHLGLIAQEVRPMYPEFVNELNGKLFLDYSSLAAVFAVQGLKQVKSWMSKYETKEDQLRKRVDQLEKVIIEHGWEIPAA